MAPGPKEARKEGRFPCGWMLNAERKEDEDVGGEEEEMRHIVAAAWGPVLHDEHQNGAENGLCVPQPDHTGFSLLCSPGQLPAAS